MARSLLVAFMVATALVPAPAVRAAVEYRPPRTILFSRSDATGTHIFAVEPDGTGLTQLTFGPAKDVDPAWASDATSITFSRKTAGGTDAWVMAPDGSDARLFMTNARSLVWSFSGDAVAFVRSRHGNRDIWTAQADGSGRVRLTRQPTADVQPAWTWDGRISFVSDRSGRDRIYVIDPDGTDLVRLSSGPGEQRHPASWQLGLVYEQDDGHDRDIVRMSTLGGSVEVEVGSRSDDRDPDVALDGELVFRRVRADGTSALIHRWMDLGASSTTLSAGDVADRAPAWAPAFAWLLAQDDQAKGNLLEAAATAQGIRDDTGSFDDAGVIEMSSADPSLEFLAQTIDSTDPEEMSILPDGSSWSAAALSQSGMCFFIRLDDVVGRTYGLDASASAANSCSGADAAERASQNDW